MAIDKPRVKYNWKSGYWQLDCDLPYSSVNPKTGEPVFLVIKRLNRTKIFKQP